MENFIYEYFISPIWERSGYNLVNTLFYALIAIGAVYLIYRYMKGRIAVDNTFLVGTLSFVLFGSTIRTVTDAIDGGVFKAVTPIHQFVLDSHLWDYGYVTVSPGVYILTAALFLTSVFVLDRIKRMEWLAYIGLALWIPHMLLLLPFMEYAIYALPILLLAFIPTYIAWMYYKNMSYVGVVGGQALDGAATFFVIDFFSQMTGIQYFEQHVVGGVIGTIFGTFFVFYLVKTAIAFLAVHVLKDEKGLDDEDRRFIALAIMIMGFAPGIRDILRMVVGS